MSIDATKNTKLAANNRRLHLDYIKGNYEVQNEKFLILADLRPKVYSFICACPNKKAEFGF